MIQLTSSMKKSWETFLLKREIKPDKSIQETFVKVEDDSIIGTISRFNNIIKCVAVDETKGGGSLFNEMISIMMNRIFLEQYKKVFVYTKPNSSKAFEYLGFKEIERVENTLVFLEKGLETIDQYVDSLRSTYTEANKVGAIVMNANPFTLGHQYLVETASKQCDILHLFVLSEEASLFSFSERYELVKQGTAHLKNVIYHPTDAYMVSQATFPAYFLKDDAEVAFVQATLDAQIFLKYFVPTLGITHRFVGEEPCSEMTNIYNEAMKQVFRQHIELIIIPRKTSETEIISASLVRSYLVHNDFDSIKKLVPATTFNYLKKKYLKD